MSIDAAKRHKSVERRNQKGLVPVSRTIENHAHAGNKDLMNMVSDYNSNSYVGSQKDGFTVPIKSPAQVIAEKKEKIKKQNEKFNIAVTKNPSYSKNRLSEPDIMPESILPQIDPPSNLTKMPFIE